MARLALVLFILIGVTLAGSAIVAVLVAGMGTQMPIIYAAVAGFVVAAPVSWMVAKAIYNG